MTTTLRPYFEKSESQAFELSGRCCRSNVLVKSKGLRKGCRFYFALQCFVASCCCVALNFFLFNFLHSFSAARQFRCSEAVCSLACVVACSQHHAAYALTIRGIGQEAKQYTVLATALVFLFFSPTTALAFLVCWCGA